MPRPGSSYAAPGLHSIHKAIHGQQLGSRLTSDDEVCDRDTTRAFFKTGTYSDLFDLCVLVRFCFLARCPATMFTYYAVYSQLHRLESVCDA